MSWLFFQEDWALGHDVTFDGAVRRIYLSPNVTSFSVKEDFYSNWKEWMTVRDNSKYLPAFRTIGGDAVGGGQYAGDIYFLINDWQIVIETTVKVDGILYHDNPALDPFIVEAGGGVTSTVSNLAIAYGTTGGSGATAADVWSYSSRTLSTAFPTAPTVTEIRQEIDSNSTQLAAIKAKTDTIAAAPTPAAIADAVRTELTPELAKIMTLENNPGMTPTQATMLLEMYNLLGLDPTKPLFVSKTSRTAGTINQSIAATEDLTVVTRV